MKRIPEYKNLPDNELPPYQLFKRWQKAANTTSMERFGEISRQEMLTDIKNRSVKHDNTD